MNTKSKYIFDLKPNYVTISVGTRFKVIWPLTGCSRINLDFSREEIKSDLQC